LSGCLARLADCSAVRGARRAAGAQAGLFDDEEARRQIKDLSIKNNERFDTVAKGQIELANQIQALREENSRLRGQVETLTYELETAKKRQQDFYVDLDGRLRKLEPQAAASAEAKPAEESKSPAEAARKAVSDPAAETREYEAALNLFRANKLKEAAAAFDAFARDTPG
jgi:TolA-binding protein